MPEDPHHIEIIARGLAVQGQQLLVCSSRKHGYLYLPGGHVERGESSASALVREFMEETGLEVVAGSLLLVSENAFTQSGRDRHEINLVFHVEHPPTWPLHVQSLESDIEFRWIELAAVVDADLRPATIKAWVVAGCRPDGWVWHRDV
ncbi:MAG: NUDIX domain-containing protein [Phycisphaeraceae bacterium]|nr:NUDIX domain-containing protein [Phycisphaeraceae bacterium]